MAVTTNKKKKCFIISGSILFVLVMLIGGTASYLGDYYRADPDAINAFQVENTVEMQTTDEGEIFFEPENADTGIIFYPGGKVEYTAYIPLMKALASEGILCILVEMPFNLAVLDVNAADGIQEDFPQIEQWFIGGHSLGGAMAASYLSEHTEEYEGLILLGAYAAEDLTHTDLQVLSIFGTEDQVMDREKYASYKSNLPETFTEIRLEGGCHAYFGMYGAQEGDGTPTISNEDQIRETAWYIYRTVLALR